MTSKINGNKGLLPPVHTSPAQKGEKPGKARGADVRDRVDFSSVLKGVDRLQEPGKSAPSGRDEMVQSLKGQIESGTYRPDLDKVAHSLLKYIADKK